MGKHYLHIYKASAGSGKTFTLAVNYIRLLIQHPEAYRHILAVTFTNKATAEMKQRILGKLYGIANELEDARPYLEEVKRVTGMDDTCIRDRAREALSSLIHNYSHFRVETIDSFFQSVLRGLAHELDLGIGMTIELDTKKAISESVDLLLRELKVNDATLSWIEKYISKEIDDGKSWNITDELKKFAWNIHREDYLQSADTLRKQLTDQQFIKGLRDRLKSERSKASARITQQATSFFNILKQHNLTINDFSYGSTGACSYYLKLQKEYFHTELKGRVLTASQTPSGWVSKTSKRRIEIEALATSTLIPHIHETERIRRESVFIINSCDLIMRHLYQLQLINTIHDRVLLLNREENRFLLADTCQMLSRMRAGDSAFVFEKLGYYIQHIMIDEFQDTSRMQWNNFLPILLEGLSHGKESMLVGDVKQAIYRWRGSDWRILNDEVTTSLASFTSPTPHKLDTNRRSLREIVDFNNMLFAQSNALLTKLLGEKDATTLTRAYHDVNQQHKPDNNGGYVRVIGIEREEGESNISAMCREVASMIEELHNAGVHNNEITILTRENTHIAHLVDYMSIHNPDIHILSAEAYRLESSIAANMLIAALRWIANPLQRFSLVQLANDYHQHILNDGLDMSDILSLNPSSYGLPEQFTQRREQLLQTPLYELTEELYRLLLLEKIEGEDGYLLTFFDCLLSFCSKESADITNFLRYWDDDMHATAIPAGSTKGIEAMTIHKSKGLEFHTVIIPFCEWELNKHSTTLWVNTDDPLCNGLAIVPIEYCSKMEESIFSDNYRKEYLQQIVDSYNLLYVALTRPRNNLIIMRDAAKCSIKEGNTMNNVAQLLTMALGCAPEDTCEYGTLSVLHKEEATTTNRIEAIPQAKSISMRSEALRARFKQSTLSRRYIHGDNENHNYIEQGLLLHELFSMIRTETDVTEALRTMMRKGLIADDKQSIQLERIIRHALQHPQTKDWFSGQYELYNECNIVYNDNNGVAKTLRPDRVMRKGERLIVVDFKFAHPHPDHKQQVLDYMDLFRQMGHTQIEGYVWYVYTNHIVPINFL